MKEVQNLSNREPPVVQSPVITNVDPDDDDGETLEEESNVNGQKPSSLKNVKRANMKIDKLMAEVMLDFITEKITTIITAIV